MFIGYIYLIKANSEIIPRGETGFYVGYTSKKITKRFNEHCFKPNFKINIDVQIHKFGFWNFSASELERITSNTKEDLKIALDSKERFWIKKLNSKKPFGYNLTDGGDGSLGYKFTDLQKENHSYVMKKVMNRPGVVERMSLVAKKVQNLQSVKSKQVKAHLADKNGNSKLSWEVVREIREIYKTGNFTIPHLERLYKIRGIFNILKNKSWYDPCFVVVSFPRGIKRPKKP